MEMKVIGTVLSIIVGLLCVFGLAIRYVPRWREHRMANGGKQKTRGTAQTTATQGLEMGLLRNPNEIVRNSLQGGRLVVVVEDGGSRTISQQRAGNHNDNDANRPTPAVCGLGIRGLEGVPAGPTVVGDNGNSPQSGRSVQSCESDWGVQPTPTSDVQSRLLTPVPRDGSAGGGFLGSNRQPVDTPGDAPAATQQQAGTEQTWQAVSEGENVEDVEITGSEEKGQPIGDKQDRPNSTYNERQPSCGNLGRRSTL
ncbi:hypothetical protein QBC40DRAFT_84602 [Triangularia verruculosa]|uniref:Uncharacterized protein n=1 Tax=Triangularia verruculosa TaxID=2587418 RepID=A0AAN6XGP9_9PEZI|nr:hypothetical protein QBC40DRAFT_84602 [Triangularia verruculosa]